MLKVVRVSYLIKTHRWATLKEARVLLSLLVLV